MYASLSVDKENASDDTKLEVASSAIASTSSSSEELEQGRWSAFHTTSRSEKQDTSSRSVAQEDSPSRADVPPQHQDSAGEDHHRQDQTASNRSNRKITVWNYVNLLQRNSNYRWYYVSHLLQNLGDWFVRIASVLVVQKLSSEETTGSSLAYLILSYMIPKTFFSQFGGILSDIMDRRSLMIYIDLLSGVVVLGFLVAVHRQSLPWLYWITSLRSVLESIYYPVTTGLVPLLVVSSTLTHNGSTNDGLVSDLQLATTLNTFAWATMAMVGGVLAGSVSASIGWNACYVIDSLTFFVSALVITFGIAKDDNFNVHLSTIRSSTTAGITLADDVSSSSSDHGCHSVARTAKVTTTIRNGCQSFGNSTRYLWTCGFGLLVLQRASAAFLWGPEDIIGAAFSLVVDDDDPHPAKTSLHMGLATSVIGSGCLLGPLLLNYLGLADAARPWTLQRACIFGLALQTLGWLAIGVTAQTFEVFLACTLIRTMGSGIVWTNATLMLQTLVDKKYLGRVLAAQYAGSTLVEASIASLIGNLEDAGWDKHWLALLSAGIGGFLVSFWALYFYYGCPCDGGTEPIAIGHRSVQQFYHPVQQLTGVRKETELSKLDDCSFSSNQHHSCRSPSLSRHCNCSSNPAPDDDSRPIESSSSTAPS